MTPKRQLNVRISTLTRRQLDELTSTGATEGEVVTMAIDRMYRETFPPVIDSTVERSELPIDKL